MANLEMLALNMDFSNITAPPTVLRPLAAPIIRAAIGWL